MGTAVIVDRAFVYGLALYVRQVQLSLHRCHTHEWGALIRLVTDSSPPGDVLEALLSARATHAVPDSSPNIFVRRCLCALRIRTGRVFMTSKDLDETCALLRELIRMFEHDYPERNHMSAIRYRFAVIEGRLEFRLGWPPDGEAYSIEHIGQAGHLRTFPLSHFVGREWPKLDVTRR
jgi:hypothetical protein